MASGTTYTLNRRRFSLPTKQTLLSLIERYYQNAHTHARRVAVCVRGKIGCSKACHSQVPLSVICELSMERFVEQERHTVLPEPLIA